ncbi:YcnI family protein [Microbacterium sp.]|uniref:YcnI family protein n=1 Tax=Microbacterium sp. TaxID=51671 RepID=UPI003C775DA3
MRPDGGATSHPPRRRPQRPFRRNAARLAAGVAAALALLLTIAPAAHAHVSVGAPSATAGGYTVLTFRVPTESDTARTVGVDVHLPADTPLLSVRVKPVDGWDARLVETELPEPVEAPHGGTVTHAVTEIVWTATGEGLGPEEFGEFEASVGPLPDVEVLFFPTVQTYSDGTEVSWVEQADEGVEAEHPAPRLEISPASGDEHGHAEASAQPTAQAAATSDPSGDTAADWTTGLAVAALVASLVALGLAVNGLARSRSRP